MPDPQTKNHKPAFEVDVRVELKIDHELAISLGRLILESNTKNAALLALGHQLRNLYGKQHAAPHNASHQGGQACPPADAKP